jgi:CDP-glucose 4,6-dehydratase
LINSWSTDFCLSKLFSEVRSDRMMQHDFWKGRKVLITGHTGFKGSWLSLWLKRLGAEVVGYALAPPTSPSLFELAKVGEGMHSHLADIRDLETLLTVFGREQPEVVFHLAAQSLVRPSYEDPVLTYSTNVMGTVNLLEAVRRTESVRAVVVVTTDKCYENREWVWPYREDEAMGGHDPYSNSKGCAELVTAAFRASYWSAGSGRSVAVASARAGNVIGGGDWAQDRLLPDIIRGVLAGETVHIRNPTAVRPWQHVLEPLSGYLMLAEHLLEKGEPFARAWNFGPADADAQSVGWIVECMAGLWREMRWTQDSGPHPHEALTLKLDSSLARTLIGWTPQLDLGIALKWVVEWSRGYRDGEDVQVICHRQLSNYEGFMARGDEKRMS